MSAPLKILTGDVAENYQGFPFVVQDPNDPEIIDGTEYGIPLAGLQIRSRRAGLRRRQGGKMTEDVDETAPPEEWWVGPAIGGLVVFLVVLFVVALASTIEGSSDAHDPTYSGTVCYGAWPGNAGCYLSHRDYGGTSYGARFMQAMPTYKIAFWLSLPRPEFTPVVGSGCAGTLTSTGFVCASPAPPKGAPVVGGGTIHFPFHLKRYTPQPTKGGSE